MVQKKTAVVFIFTVSAYFMLLQRVPLILEKMEGK